MIPSGAELEQAVLGLAMASRNTLQDLDVTPTDFSDIRHAALYRLISVRDKRGEAADALTIGATLTQIPAEERVGIDRNYLGDCVGAAPVKSLAERYGRELREQATRRRLAEAFKRGAQLLESEASAAEVAEIMRGEIDAAHKDTSQAVPIGHIIDDVIEGFENPAKAHATAWPDLNTKIVGWGAGRLYVVGARPGVGKSILGVQAAIGLSEHGWVALHSLEMSKEEVTTRGIAQLGSVPLGRLMGTSEVSEPLSPRDWRKISEARGRFNDMPLSIDDRASVTLTDIRSHARALARKPEGLSAVIVDYLQLMSAPRGERKQRHEIVGEFSRGLKLLAKEMQVPVIALTQLNRASTQENRRPTMADIRESGSIEQDSDVILLLHTEDEVTTDLDLLVAKNRHGTLGPVQLTKVGEFARLEPRTWTPRFAPPPPAFIDNTN